MTDTSLYGNDNSAADLMNSLRELLASELGTFENGRAAIAIEPPKAPSPGDGLHLTLSRYPGESTAQIHQWNLRLVQRDESLSGIDKLDGAIEKIKRRYPRHRFTASPYRDDDFPQGNFSLFFNTAAYNAIPRFY